MIPVIYKLDAEGEATGTVHFFCSEGCRACGLPSIYRASPFGRAKCGLNDEAEILPGTLCEWCGKAVVKQP